MPANINRMLLPGLLLLAACTRTEPITAPATATTAPPPSVAAPTRPPNAETPASFPLATPVADSPAAGICPRVEALVVSVQILPGIPDPRCVHVRAEQQLSITNRTEGSIEVGLGPFHALLAPGQEFIITVPFEAYLAPGVHVINVTPCCGGEIVYGIDLGS